MNMALMLKVRRSEPELVQPAKPTPIEVKSLSDWDDRELLRYPASFILFYSSRTTSSWSVQDPAKTIKTALSEALVYYYPWAGRLMKDGGPLGRLVVDCTAEGALFVEADADVTLDQFGSDSLQPPFSELLYTSNAGFDAKATLGGPIFVMQVTRLKCGGFILAFTFDHVIGDVMGAVQFMTAIAELACGALSPSMLPVWERHLLNARAEGGTPTATTSSGDLINIFDGGRSSINNNNNNFETGVYRSFFFGPREIAKIQTLVIPNRPCSSFELIVAFVVHCRVKALQHAPGEPVRVIFPVNARHKFSNPPIPPGYYGNASFPATVLCPMESLHDLGNVVDEVRKAKEAVDEEYARSMIDLEAAKRGPRGVNDAKHAHGCTTFCISDLSRVGLTGPDFGWGKPMYAGTTDNGRFRNVVSSMVAYRNDKGEDGRLISIYMDKHGMDKFAITLRTLIGSI